MAETLSTLSIISFVIAGLCLGIAVFLWFFLKIPNVIGSLSGRTARKSIAKMRESNEKNGAFAYRSVSANAKPDFITKNTASTVENEEVESVEDDLRPETGLLTDNKNDYFEAEETGMLEVEETALLTDEDATVPLDLPQQAIAGNTDRKKLIMLDEVMLIHTEEVIE